MSIQENIEARTAAELFVERGKDECEELGINPRKFWSVVAATATDLAGLTAESEEAERRWRRRSGGPMTDEEAKEFGARIVDFGKYQGMAYDEVPLDYLEWLVDKQRPLTRYLDSRVIAREREARNDNDDL